MKRENIILTVLVVICYTFSSYAQFGTPKCNNPGTQLPADITHATYHSNLMNVDIGYNIYLPPNYNNSSERFPVIYSLKEAVALPNTKTNQNGFDCIPI